MAGREDGEYGWELLLDGQATKCKCVCTLAKVQIKLYAGVSTTAIKMSIKKGRRLEDDKLPADCKWSPLYGPAAAYAGERHRCGDFV